MNILVTICARGGSKGIPGKNIKPLNGKPLIGYTIETGFAFCKKFDADFELSTDDPEIKTIASNFGLETNYQRPEELATDSSGKIDVIQDLLEFKESEQDKRYDYILDMDVTSPLRNVNDLQNALHQIENDAHALNIFSVSQASRNPYFNMVEEQGNGYVDVVKKKPNIKTRQESPAVYDMNASFYIFRRQFFEEEWKESTTDRSLAYIVPHMCFDLDDPVDFKVMEILIRENLLDFAL